jgi:hypothetical protein
LETIWYAFPSCCFHNVLTKYQGLISTI